MGISSACRPLLQGLGHGNSRKPCRWNRVDPTLLHCSQRSGDANGTTVDKALDTRGGIMLRC